MYADARAPGTGLPVMDGERERERDLSLVPAAVRRQYRSSRSRSHTHRDDGRGCEETALGGGAGRR